MEVILALMCHVHFFVTVVLPPPPTHQEVTFTHVGEIKQPLMIMRTKASKTLRLLQWTNCNDLFEGKKFVLDNSISFLDISLGWLVPSKEYSLPKNMLKFIEMEANKNNNTDFVNYYISASHNIYPINYIYTINL